jgi:DNA-binding NarL/FixJ family response regulator
MDVFIAEQSIGARKALIAMVASVPDARVVGEAQGVRAAIAEILEKKPDVVLLGMHLADGSGLKVLDEVHAREPGIDCYVVSNFPSPAFRNYAQRLGALEFFDRTVGLEPLREALVARVKERH